MAQQRTGLLGRGWEETQIKVFTRWCGKYLNQVGEQFNDIKEDFKDGVKLVKLLQVIGGEKMKGRWHEKPKNRFQYLENIQIALKYIEEEKKIKLIGIDPYEIADGNLKLTLGLTWSCINKFQIEDISVEEKTARDALLIWCKKNTAGYADVSITNFTNSWSSGLGFCALINHFRPDLLNYDGLDRSDHTHNCIAAFDASKQLGLTVYLDPEDLVNTQPDEKSVVTQVSEFFHFFAGESKIVAMADKVKKTIANQKTIEDMANNYEQQAQAALDAMAEEKASLLNEDYERTVLGVRGKLSDVIKYGRVARPRIIDLRGTALRTWAALITKCKSTARKAPIPPEGKEPETLGEVFEDLEKTQAARRGQLTEELSIIEKEKVAQFENLCQTILGKCEELQKESENLEEDLEAARQHIEALLSQATEQEGNVPQLQDPYNELVELSLASRSKFTTYAIKKEVDQLIVHLNRLLDQNKGKIIQQENQNKIEAYNAKAKTYLDVAKQLKSKLVSISGSLEERRSALIEIQSEIAEKRDQVNVIDPDYEELERDGIHLGISLTPEYVKTKYSNHLKRAIIETNKIFDEMVVTYDALAAKITNHVRDLTSQTNAVSGPLLQKKSAYEELAQEAEGLKNELPTLDHPYEEIVQFNLAARVKTAPSDVDSQIDQLCNLLAKNLQQNKADIKKEEDDRRVAEYVEMAQKYVETAKAFAATVDAINGDLPSRRSQYLAKQEELNQKRDDVDNLIPPYQALERDGLHMAIASTPISITSQYAVCLSKITNNLNEIYDEMVSNYDATAGAIYERVRKVEAEHKGLSGSLEEKRQTLARLLQESEGISQDVPAIDEPFNELTEFKLNYRAKFTPKDIQGYVDQLIANINHLNSTNEGEITAQTNSARIDAYNVRAKAVIDEAKALEQVINSIDGTNEQKLVALYQKDKEVQEKQQKIETLVPLYEDLEKDSLHLSIENTPASITSFFSNMINHIQSLIQEVDKAIATAKGLEISEEQLQEFRETFSIFDKDNTRTLEPFELNACLTALGETATDQECIQIIAKYSNGAKSMDFDSYVKFMLDRFSKQETADTTKDAFKALSKDQPAITEDQLKQYFSPEDVEYMKQRLPEVDGKYDFNAWADDVFE